MAEHEGDVARGPDSTEAERAAGHGNYAVGTKLLAENDEVRVWETVLEPGERCRFHRHRCNYMWLIHEPARLRVRTLEDTVEDYEHLAGEVTFISVTEAEDVVHDLTNIDERRFRATIIELKNNDVAFWRAVDLVR